MTQWFVCISRQKAVDCNLWINSQFRQMADHNSVLYMTYYEDLIIKINVYTCKFDFIHRYES